MRAQTTAKTRAKLSKQRQKIGIELGIWTQALLDITQAMPLEHPGYAEKLAFCKKELEKAEQAMRKVNQGVSRQRAWVAGK